MLSAKHTPTTRELPGGEPGMAFPVGSNEAWQVRKAAATSRGVGGLSSFYAARGRNAEL